MEKHRIQTMRTNGHLSPRRSSCIILFISTLLLTTNASGAEEPAGCPNPGYNQLNFWVGEWAVYNLNDEQVARSSIKVAANGCAVIEQYFAHTGYSGTSLNLYNAESGTWRQLWRDSNGGTIDFTGRFESGVMEFIASGFSDQRGTFSRRMQVSEMEGGRVSQISHRTYDEGENWIVEYQFVYAPLTP